MASAVPFVLTNDRLLSPIQIVPIYKGSEFVCLCRMIRSPITLILCDNPFSETMQGGMTLDSMP
jgi:hypothetical protein